MRKTARLLVIAFTVLCLPVAATVIFMGTPLGVSSAAPQVLRITHVTETEVDVMVWNFYSRPIGRACLRARWHNATPRTVESVPVCIYDLQSYEIRTMRLPVMCGLVSSEPDLSCDPLDCRTARHGTCAVSIEHAP